MKNVFPLFLIFFLFSCKKNQVIPDPPTATYYFPPTSGDTWEVTNATTVGWDEAKLQEAFDVASTRNTFGLIVLKSGKIVKEQYWNGWDKNKIYYIASAGKSVTALVAGIAQQENTININNKVSQYLGVGWTSMSVAKENLITLKHQLTMTTGLDYNVPDQDCTDPSCLKYKADAGTQWYYHNAPYHLLHDVIAAASGKTWNAYSKEKLFDKIGMPKSVWLNHIMYCTTREAARFGSLILRKGEWNGIKILDDQNYFNAMTNTSQQYNLSYGYLWWLNGKASAMLPTTNVIFNNALVPAAPADMYMALGKDDKKIYVVPSLDVVVVRLGDDAGGSAAGPSSFDNDLWTKLKAAMKY